MTHTRTPHDRSADLPEHAAAIHRAETNVMPTSEAHEHEMRRERIKLKDEICRMIQQGTQGAGQALLGHGAAGPSG